jgi:16S rRNA (guanine527-N7)-methyltransferase
VEPEVAAFGAYLSLILKWQSVHRLVGRPDPAWIAKELFLDSLLFLRLVPPSARVIVDIGSGAGLPGIPIRIVRPDLTVILVESRRRRASFLSTVARELRLEGVRVVNARAETVVHELSQSVDAIVMRCAGPFADIVASVRPVVRPGGVVVASGPMEPDGRSTGEWVEVPISGRGRRLFSVVRL